MKVTGSHVVDVPRLALWEALQDPEVLVHTIPGCRRLEEAGDGRYSVSVEAGVASIKGLYEGEVILQDQVPPERYKLRARGQGGPGVVEAEAIVSLDEGQNGTTITYDADAAVGGMIAGVGQRMLAAVATKTAGDFFTAVERHLTREPVPAAEPEGAPQRRETPETEPRRGRVFEAPPKPAAPSPAADPRWLLAAYLAGVLASLAGVLVGFRNARSQTTDRQTT